MNNVFAREKRCIYSGVFLPAAACFPIWPHSTLSCPSIIFLEKKRSAHSSSICIKDNDFNFFYSYMMTSQCTLCCYRATYPPSGR